MNFKFFFPGIILGFGLLSIGGCEKQAPPDTTHFTKVDSVTETYLELKDTLLQTWNAMIHDDNQKLKAMSNLLHELEVSNPAKRDDLAAFEERLEQLVRSRYTQKSMGNSDVIEEYDFASNSLISELVSLAESQKEFAYNTTLQKLVETIRTADQRVDNYRNEYDRIASSYNKFIEENKELLKEVDEASTLEKKPLFQTMAEE